MTCCATLPLLQAEGGAALPVPSNGSLIPGREQ